MRNEIIEPERKHLLDLLEKVQGIGSFALDKTLAECEQSPNVSVIDHPSHYQGNVECIDEMEHVFGIEAVKAFCKLNVWKYRYRAESKNGKEDLEKADWYMNKLIELNKRGERDNEW